MVLMLQKNVLYEFISFLRVGVIATACHYLLLIFLVEVFNSDVLIASTIGALLGATVNYVLNYKLTFQSTLAHVSVVPKFVGVAILALVLNWLLMKFLTETLLIQYLLAQIMTTILLIVVTYGLNKIWSFREKR